MELERYVERLNRAREEKGLSVDALARRSGYPADLVAPLLRGSPIAISEQMNSQLCKALGLDPHEVWPEHGEGQRGKVPERGPRARA